MTLYDRNGCPTPVLSNSDEYRENWDRIFRNKVRCEACGERVPLDGARQIHGPLLFMCDACWHADEASKRNAP